MSVKVQGVIDLPHVDLRDFEVLQELLFFLYEEGLIDLSEWSIYKDGDTLRLTHKTRAWSYIHINSIGTVEWDAHYKETTAFKDKLLKTIGEYYPAFKKAYSIAQKYKAKLSLSEDKEKIILEVQDG
ncbi:MAG: hypothetical protein ACK42C_00095 [Aquificaceae bacterium]